MAYPVPTVAELAAFSGRDVDSYTAFAGSALAQSALMFSILTGLTEAPTDADKAQLAEYAVMEMADRIYLEQPYATAMAGPFQSETIGSYSYSKGGDFWKRARSGAKTGLWWWDLAIAELGLAEVVSGIAFSSIQAFENLLCADEDGNLVVHSPADEEAVEGGIGFYNANSTFRLG